MQTSRTLPQWPWWVLLLMLLTALLAYQAATLSPRHKAPWPWWRFMLWTTGLLIAGAALFGPIATRAHDDFRFHMIGHLLLGMMAPIFLVLAAPITVLFRALPTTAARRVARILMSRPFRLLAHPITAAILDIGGLWLLYLTRLFGAMHAHPWLDIAIHVHIALAGYLFTASIIGIDPVRHRPGWAMRSTVVIAASAAHAILAKYLYADMPAGVPATQAHEASKVMYYGGDAVEILLITIFCLQWYRAATPRASESVPVTQASPRNTVYPVIERASIAGR